MTNRDEEPGHDTAVYVFTATGYCARPACRRMFDVSLGSRGRNPKFCSEDCRREGETEYKRAKARVEHVERMLRIVRSDLAAFGRDPFDEETTDE